MSKKTTFKPIRIFFLFISLFLTMASCGPDPFFIPVVSINGVPETGTAGMPLALTGTVSPSFASNNTIVWLVENAGTTGVSINGNILDTSASGIVIIKAKIANGLAEGIDYTQDFKIVINKTSNENIITNIEDLQTLLENLPANTDSTPHTIKMIINDPNDFEAIKTTFFNAQNKYVYLDISDSDITEIPDCAFFDSGNSEICATLTGITLPNKIERIGDRAFENCSNLFKINIPNKVLSIGELAFADCINLTDVTIGISVTKIDNQAFYYCSALTSVTIPDSVTDIGSGTFAGCFILNSVKFEGDNISFGYEAFHGDLQNKYLTGGMGTYTTDTPGYNAVWIKQ